MSPDKAAERIETLVARCEAIEDAALRAEVLELLGLVLELHGSGLKRLMVAAAEAPHLEAAIAAWARDAEIGALCELHGVEIPRRSVRAAAANFVPIEDLTLR